MSTGGASLLASTQAKAADTGAPVRLGLIGCGGRGTLLTTEMIGQDAQLVALADLFPDKLETARQKFDEVLTKRGMPPLERSRLYHGPEAAKGLINDPGVNAVYMAITPYFYPVVLEEAIASGKHIYCEKPVATDVAGALKVMDLARRAEGRQVFHVGFQNPHNPALKEMVRRVHAGAIGRIVTAEAHFLYNGWQLRRRPGLSDAEARLRSWVGDRILSGDIIVEQNVHSIDKLNWVMQAHPVAAVASGGRGARTDYGDIWDHFNAILQYPNNVTVSFRSAQFVKGWTSVTERFFGTRGTTESHYSGPVRIYGEEPWDPGVKGARAGTEEFKARAFLHDVRTGTLSNEGIRGAESTLTAILIRTAAYERREITWDGLLSSHQRWDAHIDLSKLG